MRTEKKYWELKIIDAFPGENTSELHSLAAGDIFNNGCNYMISGGRTGLYWYNPRDMKKGKIDEGFFHVGLALEDIDGDGILEIVAAEQQLDVFNYRIVWYKPGKTADDKWEKYILDPSCKGNPHDLLFSDIDGDGVNELLSVAAYTQTPGIFIHKPEKDIKSAWKRYQVMDGHLTEGFAVADLNGDGKLEIVSGPDWYTAPKDGPYSGLWERRIYAKSFRDMCRVAVVDVTGNGRPDIVAVESEYREGSFSWFENRVAESNEWIEHRIDDVYIFAHSIDAWNDEKTGAPNVFIGEMAEGGWNQPYNWDARLLQFSSSDRGATWEKETLYKGAGTHQAFLFDIDNDGEMEIVGKSWRHPVVQIFKKPKETSPILSFKHSFIDRDKRMTGTDIMAADIDGDGIEDVVCAKWWYKAPNWEKYLIPGIYQALYAYDIDGDGRQELICTKLSENAGESFTSGLTSDFYWLKPIEPEKGVWEEYFIGKGKGSWPHGIRVAKIGEDDKPVLMAAYHSGKHQNDYPEIFKIDGDPKKPWKAETLFEKQYGEEIVEADINGNGIPDLILGEHWLENDGKYNFTPYKYTENFEIGRICAVDINGNGLTDIVIGEEVYKKDDNHEMMVFTKLAWFENPGNSGDDFWKTHVIDTIRSPHSLSIVDIDGDGELEIICGEHDPFQPERSRSRLFVYKKADSKGLSWYRYLIDDRFEHHDGAKVIKLANGKTGIISHGWGDKQYLNLWEFE